MLLIGVGNPMRGDDGVGPEVASRVGRLLLPGVEVAAEIDPLALLDHLQRTPPPDVVVVVDATAPGSEPGRVRLHRVGSGSLRHGSPFGSHGLGVADAVELARTLDLLPRQLILVGIEAKSANLGADLSAAVRAGLDDAVTAVVALLTGTPATPP